MFRRAQYKYLLVVSLYGKCLTQWDATTSYESYRETVTIMLQTQYGLQIVAKHWDRYSET